MASKGNAPCVWNVWLHSGHNYLIVPVWLDNRTVIQQHRRDEVEN